MHEFSIALNIVDIVTNEALKSEADKVIEVELEIGELSGVIYEAMDFALESAVKNTLMENARIKTVKTPGKAFCNDCQKEFQIHDLFEGCPECGDYNLKIISGKELRVISINIE